MDQRIGNVCPDHVVTVTTATSVAEAAALMREHHIGALVIVDKGDAARPIGIVTDRDIVVEVVATGLDACLLTVGEIVQRAVRTVSAEASFAEVVREMSINGVRRLPVVNSDGTLAGIVSLDDVLLELVSPLAAIGDLAGRERRFEARTRTA